MLKITKQKEKCAYKFTNHGCVHTYTRIYIIYITSILGVKNLTNFALSNRLEMLNFKTNKKST